MISGYSIPPFLGAVSSLLIGAFVFIKNRKSELHLSFFVFCFSLFIWLFGYTVAYSVKSEEMAILFCRIACTGAMFTAPGFYHFTVSLLKLNRERRAAMLSYIVMLMIVPFSMGSKYFLSGTHKYFWGYYSKAGLLHPVYLIVFFGIFIRGFFLLYTHYRKIKTFSPPEANQTRYVFLAYVIALMGAIDYVPKYGVEFYPFGFIFGISFALIIAYAIVRYRLMDIKVVLTRTGIFLAVYTFVLGIPFVLVSWCKPWLSSKIGANWWMAPLAVMAVLASAAPFIYLYLNRKAEERLFREQRRYQDTLRYASIGMTRLRDVKKLLVFMAHVTARVVRLRYACVYLLDNGNSHYKMEAIRSREKHETALAHIEADSPLIKWLLKQREPLVMGEIKRRLQDMPQKDLNELSGQLDLMSVALVVPSFVRNKLLGFMILGDKISGEIYTQDDLHVFTVLANQAALAIENARFIDEVKEMQEQISQAEKMATIGTMADGLSHQMNNRFHALSLIAGDTLDTIKLADTAEYSPRQKDLLSQVKHGLERIQANVLQGAELVKGMLKYTRKGERGFSVVALDKIIDATLEMVQYKIKLNNIDIIRDYPRESPLVYGNFTQLLEVFFNLIDNAYDAATERKDALKEEGYRPRIRIYAEDANNGCLKIHIEDNGMGVRPEDVKKMFTPFFTTKASSRKGTGLGLYVIQKIITTNHSGKIYVASHYAQGTTFTLELPAVNAQLGEDLFQGAQGAA